MIEKGGPTRDRDGVEGTMMEKGGSMVDTEVPSGTVMDKRGPGGTMME